MRLTPRVPCSVFALVALPAVASCAGDPLVGDYAGAAAIVAAPSPAVPAGAVTVSIRPSGSSGYTLRWVSASGDCTLYAARASSGVVIDALQPFACVAGPDVALVGSGTIALDSANALAVQLDVTGLPDPHGHSTGEAYALAFGGTRR